MTLLTVLSCIATSEQLANASRQGLKKPLSPPEVEAKKASAKFRVIKKMPVRLTAYYGPEKGQDKYVYGSYKKDVRVNGAGKETRSGKAPCVGMSAADWRVFPRGTKFRILNCSVPLNTNKASRQVSDLIMTVEDTGGAVKGPHVDIFSGFGDQGRRNAKKINDLQPKKFVIEVIEVCQSQ